MFTKLLLFSSTIIFTSLVGMGIMTQEFLEIANMKKTESKVIYTTTKFVITEQCVFTFVDQNKPEKDTIVEFYIHDNYCVTSRERVQLLVFYSIALCILFMYFMIGGFNIGVILLQQLSPNSVPPI